jgi:hypothetical protein
MPWQPSACLNIAGNENTIGSNLKGSSTSNELMTEVSLVLGGGLVLDPVAINTTQHHITKGKAHVIVRLSVLVVVVEPTHDDDICKVCRDE